MEFFDEEVLTYVEQHCEEESELLKQIHRETYLQVLKPRMLSGHLQGRVLSMFSKMISPTNILEIGTYTGYSALCLAEGLATAGKLITIDKNEELEERVQAYFDASTYASQIDYRIGNAMSLVPSLKNKWDLVFIDADKVNYLNYFKLVIDQMQSGGFIIADNVLWSGKVLESRRKRLDEDTKAILEFNEAMRADARVEQVLMPIRDGLFVIRKK